MSTIKMRFNILLRKGKTLIKFCVFLAQFVSTLANLEGEESFDAVMLGSADEVMQQRVCDDELILIKGLVAVKQFINILNKCCTIYFDQR